MLTLVPYWVAGQEVGETTTWFNVLIHALGSAGVDIDHVSGNAALNGIRVDVRHASTPPARLP